MSHMPIGPVRGAARVPVRTLRNDTAAIVDRVAGGEVLTLTVRGRSVATIAPLRINRRWVSRAEFIRIVLRLRPDDALADDARAVSSEPLDDLD